MKYGEALYAALNDPKANKKDFIAACDTSYVVKAVRDVLKNELEQAKASRETDYDKANWAFYQAHNNGKVEALTKLLDLLS